MSKKIILNFIFICFLFIIGLHNVEAYHMHSEATNKVANGEGFLLCEYAAENTSDGVRIYYYPSVTNNANSAVNYAWWDVFYKTGDKWQDIYNPITRKSLGYGSFTDVFSVNGRIHYNEEDNRLENEDKFVCPKYAFIDTDLFNEICLSDNGNCGDKFDRDRENLLDNPDTLFSKIIKYAEEDVYSSGAITYDEYYSSDDTKLISLVISKTKEYIKNTYFKDKYVFPEFLSNYIDNIDSYLSKGPTEEYQKFIENLNKETDQKVSAGEISSDEATKRKEKTSKSYEENLGVEFNTSEVPSIPSSDDDSCTGILTADMTIVVKNILKFIQYLGPVLVIVFTVFDFVKAALSGDQGELKKASSRFSKRLVAAILLFFIPIIVSLLFNLTGITVPDDCLFK